jgi:hypothetical protein
MNLAETRTHEPLVNKPKAKKPKKAMPKVTKKRNQLNRQYMKLREAFLKKHYWCQFHIAEKLYATPATEIHHKKGRGKFLLDTSTWMAVSSRAHKEIHENTKYSYEKGYMLLRR